LPPSPPVVLFTTFVAVVTVLLTVLFTVFAAVVTVLFATCVGVGVGVGAGAGTGAVGGC
jgi:hypothetical protein